MSRFEEEKQALVRLITEAFAPGVYPGDNNLTNDGTHYHPSDQYDIYRVYKGRHWQDITLRDLEAFEGDKCAALAFMSDEARSYYLPAHMISSLDTFDTKHCRDKWEVLTTVLHALVSTRGTRDGMEWRLLQSLHDQQKQAVRGYLSFIIKYCPTRSISAHAARALGQEF
ncbi:MAG: hypothetical protein KF774_06960 [Planctomyces sp.]|nr:hypothetical protein [Planctomyces sp.]